MNFLLTGAPGVGKTTILKRFAELLGGQVTGFLTVEVREESRRIGFDIVTFDGRRGILARKGLDSPYRIGRYGIDLDSFERIAIPALKPTPNNILIIDEIGKMELKSDRFRDVLLRALDSDATVVAAIMQSSHPFADSIKDRSDCKIVEATRRNRDYIPERLIGFCEEL